MNGFNAPTGRERSDQNSANNNRQGNTIRNDFSVNSSGNFNQLGDPNAYFQIRHEPIELPSVSRIRQNGRYVHTGGFDDYGEGNTPFPYDGTIGFEAFLREERTKRKDRETMRLSRVNGDESQDSVESSSENDEVGERCNSDYSVDEMGLEYLDEFAGSLNEDSSGIFSSEDSEDEMAMFSDSTIEVDSDKSDSEQIAKAAVELNVKLEQKYIRKLTCTFEAETIHPVNEEAELRRHHFNHLRERDLLNTVSGPAPNQLTPITQFYLNVHKAINLAKVLNRKSFDSHHNPDCSEENLRILTEMNDKLQELVKVAENDTSIGIQDKEKRDQQCIVEGCRNDELISSLRSKLKNFSLEDELESDFEWPAVLLTQDKTSYPISARDISTFLCRESDRDEYSKLDKIGNLLIQRAYHCMDNSSECSMDSASLSIMTNFDAFPIRLFHRGKFSAFNNQMSSLLRPCLIDGIGIAYAANKEFNPKWKGINEMYSESRVLPMFPIIQTVFRLVLMGHKVKLVLPSYYEVPYYAKQKRVKVDNLYAFDRLRELGLVQFINASNIQDFMLQIQEIAQKEGSIIFTSTQLCMAHKGNESRDEDPGEYEVMYGLNTRNRPIDMQKRDKIEKNSSERLMGISFHTITNEIIVFPQYMSHIGVAQNDHAERKHAYHTVGQHIAFFYTDVDGDVRNPEIQLTNQLRFKDQTRIILAICDIYELSKFHLRAAQIFLRFARMMGTANKEFDEFIRKHKPFPPPTSITKKIVKLDLSIFFDEKGNVIGAEKEEANRM